MRDSGFRVQHHRIRREAQRGIARQACGLQFKDARLELDGMNIKLVAQVFNRHGTQPRRFTPVGPSGKSSSVQVIEKAATSRMLQPRRRQG